MGVFLDEGTPVLPLEMSRSIGFQLLVAWNLCCVEFYSRGGRGGGGDGVNARLLGVLLMRCFCALFFPILFICLVIFRTSVSSGMVIQLCEFLFIYLLIY